MRAAARRVNAEHPQLAHDFSRAAQADAGARAARAGRRRHRARRGRLRGLLRRAQPRRVLSRCARRARTPGRALAGRRDDQRQRGPGTHRQCRRISPSSSARASTAHAKPDAGSSTPPARAWAWRRTKCCTSATTSSSTSSAPRAPACAPAGSTATTCTACAAVAACDVRPDLALHHPRPRWPTGWTRTHAPHHERRRMSLPACFAAADDADAPAAVLRRPRRLRRLARGAGRPRSAAWLDAHAFDGRRGHALLRARRPTASPARVLGIGDPLDPSRYAHAPFALPPGDWRARRRARPGRARRAAARLGPGQLPLRPLQAAAARAGALAARRRRDAIARRSLAACVRVRDLVNTPTEHMGPDQLEQVVLRARRTPTARRSKSISGEDLLAQNFPAIHAVGRASHRAPRLIELRLGRRRAPARRDRRQGRVLRHRRPRHQGRRRHAQHEEGHGRRRARDRAGASW